MVMLGTVKTAFAQPTVSLFADLVFLHAGRRRRRLGKAQRAQQFYHQPQRQCWARQKPPLPNLRFYHSPILYTKRERTKRGRIYLFFGHRFIQGQNVFREAIAFCENAGSGLEVVKLTNSAILSAWHVKIGFISPVDSAI